MLAPSKSRAPRFLVAEARSLPARSMIESVELVASSDKSPVLFLIMMLIWRTAWEREDVAFASVGEEVRFSLPCKIKFITSSTYPHVSSKIRACVQSQGLLY
jgi:hypothetical protein